MPPRIRSPTPSDQEDQLASSSSPPPPPPRPSHSAANPLAGLKIKFKLGSAGTPPPQPTTTTTTTRPKRAAAAKGKGKGRASQSFSDPHIDERRLTRGTRHTDSEDDDDDESDLLTDDGDYGRTASTSKPTRAAASSRRTSSTSTTTTARKPRASARVSAPKRSTRGSASVSATQSASAFSSDTDQLASEEDDELVDHLLDDDDDDDDDDDQDQDGDVGLDGDGYSSNGSEMSGSTGDLYGGRKTARQRAKELGGDDALELMSLPNRAFSCSLLVLENRCSSTERETVELIFPQTPPRQIRNRRVQDAPASEERSRNRSTARRKVSQTQISSRQETRGRGQFWWFLSSCAGESGPLFRRGSALLSFGEGWPSY